MACKAGSLDILYSDDVCSERLSQSLNLIKVHGLVLNPVRVVESELRKTPLDRHLTALESYLVLVAGTCLSSLGTAGGSATLAGTLATA